MEAAQCEWGTGQWEMTFRYGDPLEMADRHALYKLAVRDSAAAAGMSATFMAKPLNGGQPGSSCHVHFSALDESGVSASWDDGSDSHMSDRMLNAIGGVLQEVPAFMAWYAPTINSYRRANSADVAGWGRTRGMDNRTTSVRVVGHKPEDIRFAFRLPRADTNPYLTLAALLASARQGIAQRIASHRSRSRTGTATRRQSMSRCRGTSGMPRRHSPDRPSPSRSSARTLLTTSGSFSSTNGGCSSALSTTGILTATLTGSDMPTDIPILSTWIDSRPELSAEPQPDFLHDPNTGERLQENRSSSTGQTERAIESAWSAHESRTWYDLGLEGRATFLLRLADLIDEQQSVIATLYSLNSGVTLRATTLFASSLGDTIRSAVEIARARGESSVLTASQGQVKLRRIPRGRPRSSPRGTPQLP